MARNFWEQNISLVLCCFSVCVNTRILTRFNMRLSIVKGKRRGNTIPQHFIDVLFLFLAKTCKKNSNHCPRKVEKNQLHNSGSAMTQVQQVVCKDAVPMHMWSRKPMWDDALHFCHSLTLILYPIHPSQAAAAAAICRGWMSQENSSLFCTIYMLTVSHSGCSRMEQNAIFKNTNKQANKITVWAVL